MRWLLNTRRVPIARAADAANAAERTDGVTGRVSDDAVGGA